MRGSTAGQVGRGGPAGVDTGVPGPQGAAGNDGAPGATGPAGADGANGLSTTQFRQGVDAVNHSDFSTEAAISYTIPDPDLGWIEGIVSTDLSVTLASLAASVFYGVALVAGNRVLLRTGDAIGVWVVVNAGTAGVTAFSLSRAPDVERNPDTGALDVGVIISVNDSHWRGAQFSNHTDPNTFYQLNYVDTSADGATTSPIRPNNELDTPLQIVALGSVRFVSAVIPGVPAGSTYAGGVPDTITCDTLLNAASSAALFDDVTLTFRQRVLITDGPHQGIFQLSTPGSDGVTAWVLSRAVDAPNDSFCPPGALAYSAPGGTLRGNRTWQNLSPWRELVDLSAPVATTPLVAAADHIDVAVDPAWLGWWRIRGKILNSAGLQNYLSFEPDGAAPTGAATEHVQSYGTSIVPQEDRDRFLIGNPNNAQTSLITIDYCPSTGEYKASSIETFPGGYGIRWNSHGYGPITTPTTLRVKSASADGVGIGSYLSLRKKY